MSGINNCHTQKLSLKYINASKIYAQFLDRSVHEGVVMYDLNDPDVAGSNTTDEYRNEFFNYEYYGE